LSETGKIFGSRDLRPLGGGVGFPPAGRATATVPTASATAGAASAEKTSNGTHSHTRYEIAKEEDLLTSGREIWLFCLEMGFSTVESMQVRTAFSELARNILKYAVKGEVIASKIGDTGIKLLFIDQGPGIPDIEQAMQYGFSTGGSLGLGLPGSKKLADHFDIVSSPGKGTQVTFIKYRKAAPRKTEAILRESLRAGGGRAPGAGAGASMRGKTERK
jgi:serine/threonine-protein kinase RsbT